MTDPTDPTLRGKCHETADTPDCCRHCVRNREGTCHDVTLRGGHLSRCPRCPNTGPDT